MTDVSLAAVTALVAAANAGSGNAARELEARFRTSERLAVYGTLAPGQPNHHMLAHLGGEWRAGVVEGERYPVGWGAILGYPAFRPRAGGPAVAVQVLTAPALLTAWPLLDDFEGAEYRRMLVPVLRIDDRRLDTVANLYAIAE